MAVIGVVVVRVVFGLKFVVWVVLAVAVVVVVLGGL